MLFLCLIFFISCVTAPSTRFTYDRDAAEALWSSMDRMSRMARSAEERLEVSFPNVPASERGMVGLIPRNLYVSFPSLSPLFFSSLSSLLFFEESQADDIAHLNIARVKGLIQGADSSGRLTFPIPAPGHVLLLTKPIPEGRLVTGSHLITSTSASQSIANAGLRTVRGFGVLRDASGNSHYFRTIPFDPPPAAPQRHVPWVESLNHIPPRDTDAGLFKHRPIALELGAEGEKAVYRSKDKVVLSHVSVLPVTGPRGEGELRVYPDKLLEEVLAGPYGEPVWRASSSEAQAQAEAEAEGKALQKDIEEENTSTRRNKDWIQWADQPNWSSQESKALTKPPKGKAKLLELPSFREMRKSASENLIVASPKKWLDKMKKNTFRSNKSFGARLGNVREGEKSDGVGSSSKST
ncbi:uncharacterized protein UTRI_06465_B [Ustilago trichophora]|uniref:Uncharacterized protein n=1 Tax=Ustilago trichophora TaxID=86804 RepID=A0A5C3ELT7_9BASI|nr:uncharacterized protein UTRI_06465_B [Ustilago trichophora]